MNNINLDKMFFSSFRPDIESPQKWKFKKIKWIN
jgi:hypothetical protein